MDPLRSIRKTVGYQRRRNANLACGQSNQLSSDNAYKGLRSNNTDLNRRREALVGRLRNMLARQSAAALEPDLIVLDEFQRFHNLLHGDSEAAKLARLLFDFEDTDGNTTKTLLLSATP